MAYGGCVSFGSEHIVGDMYTVDGARVVPTLCECRFHVSIYKVSLSYFHDFSVYHLHLLPLSLILFAGASVANIGKNVGFLAASASRAAIHQSLSQGGSSMVPADEATSSEETSKSRSTVKPKSTVAAARSSNLGDVTAKAGSQAIVASLLGTVIGIFFSRTFCSDYGTAGILAGFVVLSAVHQVCTYKAVKVVPLRSLDRHRLHIVLTAYIAENYERMIGSRGHDKWDRDSCASMDLGNEEDNGKALTPAQVAEKESFLPMMPPDESVRWLTIGDSLRDICPLGVTELEGLLLPNNRTTHDEGFDKSSFVDPGDFNSKQYEKYILKLHPLSTTITEDFGMVQLTFFEGATDNDQIRGMLHAYMAHALMKNNDPNPNDSSNQHMLESQILMETHTMMISQMPMLIEHLSEVGWQMGTGFVNVECGPSHRLKIQNV